MVRFLQSSAFLALAMILAISTGPAMAAEGDPPKQGSPYEKVASGRPPVRDGAVPLYTNSDLEKMFGIVAEADRESSAKESADADPKSSEATTKKADEDPLVWLKKRQEAAAARSVELAEAEKQVADARQRLADLERQKMAVRNPYAARPQLSEEEEKRRREGGESASARFERTEALVKAAREELRAAEAKLAQLRSQRL